MAFGKFVTAQQCNILLNSGTIAINLAPPNCGQEAVDDVRDEIIGMEVSLKQITHAEVATIAGIELSTREEDFAGGSMGAIAERLKARQASEDYVPFLIMADRKIAGFLMLRKGHALPGWAVPNAVSLHNFRICGNMQGRGCGKTTVILAAHWIAARWPQASMLMLSVNVENFAAKEFYLRCGFQDTGETHYGRLGVEDIMSCRISDLLRQST